MSLCIIQSVQQQKFDHRKHNMATETHIDAVFPSGTGWEIDGNSRFVLIDSAGTIFIQVGSVGCSDTDLHTIQIGVEGARKLKKSLGFALNNAVGDST